MIGQMLVSVKILVLISLISLTTGNGSINITFTGVDPTGKLAGLMQQMLYDFSHHDTGTVELVLQQESWPRESFRITCNASLCRVTSIDPFGLFLGLRQLTETPRKYLFDPMVNTAGIVNQRFPFRTYTHLGALCIVICGDESGISAMVGFS